MKDNVSQPLPSFHHLLLALFLVLVRGPLFRRAALKREDADGKDIEVTTFLGWSRWNTESINGPLSLSLFQSGCAINREPRDERYEEKEHHSNN